MTLTVAPSLAPLSVREQMPRRPAVLTLDEAMARSQADRAKPRFVQGALALDSAASAWPSWAVDDEETTDEDLATERFFGPQATPASALPDPHRVAGQIGLALAEAMAGVRSPVQLVRWTTPEVYAVVARRAATVARRSASRDARSLARPRIKVLRVRVCCPADGVAEAALVLQDGPRVRAMALRLTGLDGRWRVEVLQIA